MNLVLGDVAAAAVLLRVADVATSVTWYREHLELEPVHVGADEAGGVSHPYAGYQVAGTTIGLWQLPPGQQRTSRDADRTTYVVLLTAADPGEMRVELRSRGVVVDELRESAEATFFWFYDPDGNRWEVSRMRQPGRPTPT